VLLEGVFRKYYFNQAHPVDVANLLNWQPVSNDRPTIPVFPGRVILQDFTGIPVINDLAAHAFRIA
jgi:aconitate hydratase